MDDAPHERDDDRHLPDCSEEPWCECAGVFRAHEALWDLDD